MGQNINCHIIYNSERWKAQCDHKSLDNQIGYIQIMKY